MPAPETVAASQKLPITGVQVVDSFAASHAGAMAFNVSSTGGDIAMTDASGTALAGSGSTNISVQDTFAQINADLATLNYAAGAIRPAGKSAAGL